MIIWSGKGFLVPVIVFIVSLVMELITEAITKNENFYQENEIWVAFALLISCLIVYGVGKMLGEREVKNYLDKDTGEHVVLKKEHTFFFLNMKIWAVILFVLGVGTLIKSQI